MQSTNRMQFVADGYVAAQKFCGIEWQVERAGAVLQSGRAGCAEFETQRPIPETALYQIFSMTKPIISVLALRLIDQGRLRLYDLVAQFNPAFAKMKVLGTDGSITPAQRLITVEDLLMHRAGFSYEFILGCHVAPYYRGANILADGHRSMADMMTALAALPLAFHPGTAWRYSVATDVLAHMIECATGCDLSALLQAEIFGPLGMKDTGFCVPRADRHRLMAMYGPGDLTGLPPVSALPHSLVRRDISQMCPVDKPDFRRGGLGLYASLNDYMCFARMLLTGRTPQGDAVVSSKMHDMLQRNRITLDQLPLSVGAVPLRGYGWGLTGRVMIDPGAATAPTSGGEFGWAGAADTYFWVDPREDMVGVVMTQFLGGALPLAEDMRTAAYQSL
ncbi:MAG: beta-lactamase family protein [Rhodobacteraceae bacterium]|nr:beta-lactamase family protein [Paracoccaceae bacterium]